MSHLHEDGDRWEETHARIQKKRSGMINRFISVSLTVDGLKLYYIWCLDITMVFKSLWYLDFRHSQR